MSKTQIESLVVRCGSCEAHVNGDVRGYYVEEADNDPTTLTRYVFVRCPRCTAPFLLAQLGDWHHDLPDGPISWSRARCLYPAEPDWMDPSVPKVIADSYLEARRTLNDAAANTATAIMCRRTIEGICSYLGAQGRTLHAKLEDLKARGTIDPRLHEWANDVLRDLGNDAAHDVGTVVSREDARDALEFTRAIIEYLFVFADAFKRFKERRVKSSGTASAANQS